MPNVVARSMAEKVCVVIFSKADIELVRVLVAGLENEKLRIWWSEEIAQGRWEQRVRQEIQACDALIPIVSGHSVQHDIFVDEWRYAQSLDKDCFPFVLDDSPVPLGMGGYSRTFAQGWNGDLGHSGFQMLKRKLESSFIENGRPKGRPQSTPTGTKSLELPAFMFSLSTFETQLDPINGLQLMEVLDPAACLISAYDAYKYIEQDRRDFWRSIKKLRDSNSVLVLDSGHYEATRKDDYWARKNKSGWIRERFHEAARAIPADIVFSYDNPEIEGTSAEVVDQILDDYVRDWVQTGLGPGTLCPIVHLPEAPRWGADAAASIVAGVAKEVRPALIAIPERELGDGIFARMKTVMSVRRALDELGFYQPLHILGTGNPMTIAALSVCGGDSFDGLEWCRTAANYDSHNLMHFQHFDLLSGYYDSRMSNKAAKSIVEHEEAPFALRAASYNYDYFCYWMREVQHWIRTDQPERLLHNIQHLGVGLAAAYAELT
jgi:hypothetical protein